MNASYLEQETMKQRELTRSRCLGIRSISLSVSQKSGHIPKVTSIPTVSIVGITHIRVDRWNAGLIFFFPNAVKLWYNIKCQKINGSCACRPQNIYFRLSVCQITRSGRRSEPPPPRRIYARKRDSRDSVSLFFFGRDLWFCGVLTDHRIEILFFFFFLAIGRFCRASRSVARRERPESTTWRDWIAPVIFLFCPRTAQLARKGCGHQQLSLEDSFFCSCCSTE